MDTRERVARKIFENQFGERFSWEERGPASRAPWLKMADEIIALVRAPEDGDEHYAAAEVLKNFRAALHPGIDDYGSLRDIARDLLDSRGAVGGAWGRKAARALLQLPQEEN
jgi:hypothetical protein